MTNSARQLEKNMGEFQDAITQFQSATETLLDSWEGDAQVKFSIESRVYQKLLSDMVKDIKDFYGLIDKAVTEYTNTDEECAAILRNV